MTGQGSFLKTALNLSVVLKDAQCLSSFLVRSILYVSRSEVVIAGCPSGVQDHEPEVVQLTLTWTMNIFCQKIGKNLQH